ncbi:MAG TPA: BrnA antitoxin family protein [Candidatus Methylomirabilis sp.]|nr:BrnA antitoxin family protein [Candidatus Methylomirabilis sp.]
MRKEYDFSHGKRGAVIPASRGKTRITIRIDDDILRWFRDQVHKAGGGSYQTSINQALRTFIASQDQTLEDTLRRVLREELPRYADRNAAGRTRRRTRRQPAAAAG